MYTEKNSKKSNPYLTVAEYGLATISITVNSEFKPLAMSSSD